MKRVIVVARVLLAVLFITAGIAKWGDASGFAETLRRFELFPAWSQAGIARYAPWFEITAGFAIVTPWLHRGAAWLLMAFMLLATAALAQAYFRGLSINCGCWGNWWEVPLGTAVLRNMIILVLITLALKPSGLQGDAGGAQR